MTWSERPEKKMEVYLYSHKTEVNWKFLLPGALVLSYTNAF